MIIVGKVTGISGIFSKTVSLKKNDNLWDRMLALAFTIGLIVGGAIVQAFFELSIDDWSSLPLPRLIVGGLLVGYGTVTGNGCTSGHGVCGISSLRSRSLVATCTFMFVGIVTAMAANTSAFMPVFRNNLELAETGPCIAACIGICLVVMLIGNLLKEPCSPNVSPTDGPENTAVPKKLTFKDIFIVTADVIFGVCFALVMGISNMTKPAATISFLDLRYWNPALAFIMGSAIAVALPSFWFIYKQPRPFLASKFSLPTKKDIDAQLVIGASIFGVGWGLTGVCPGPALTNLGAGNSLAALYCLCMAVGMWLQIATYDHVSAKARGLFRSSLEVKAAEEPEGKAVVVFSA
jgi:uncharacterized membrane protein YedE/YeeE